MKKTAIFTAVIISLTLGSCGTILGGQITDCQKTKPASGTRSVRPAALVGDIIFGLIPLVVDFADGGIYQPCNTKK